jgi:hypothetical protein
VAYKTIKEHASKSTEIKKKKIANHDANALQSLQLTEDQNGKGTYVIYFRPKAKEM